MAPAPAHPSPAHLAERVAERLRGIGGLAAPEPAPERDIRRLVRRDIERKRVASPPLPLPADDADPDAADDAAETPLFADEAGDGFATAGAPYGPDDAAPDGPRSVIDASRPGPAVLADAPTSLTVPETPRTPPLDMAAMEKAGLVVGHKVRTRISEEFRITVGHILRSMHANYSPGRGSPNVIMVTSARPGEGKSFSTLNLAGSIAQHAQREVILVDVDAKQRSMSAELGLAERPGLLDLSSNPSMRVEDVILRTVIPHLSVVTIGSGHSVGADISPSRPITALIERIARRFPNAVVLLDAPPCLSTSDPSTLAPFVGQIVMVVEAERTQRNEVVAALDLIKACPSVTLMLNKIRLTTSYTFGAYHYFGTYS
jgi:receptor protein-tyrosine kinase